MVGGTQLAFDFAELEREDALGNLHEWRGAPLHFTTDYFPPGELDAAFRHWQFLYGSFGSVPRSHMWHTNSRGLAEDTQFDGHGLTMFTADLRPEPECEGAGELLYRAVCEPCEWHADSDSENAVVEGWHDHAIPGWRALPVVPAQIRVRTASGLTPIAKKWIAAHYPPEMQVPGAPIITERAPHGTRHVPGYSPWGGFDLSSTALNRPAPPEPVAATQSEAFASATLVSAAPEHRRTAPPSIGLSR